MTVSTAPTSDTEGDQRPNLGDGRVHFCDVFISPMVGVNNSGRRESEDLCLFCLLGRLVGLEVMSLPRE